MMRERQLKTIAPWSFDRDRVVAGVAALGE
jgi:hypothetical protein